MLNVFKCNHFEIRLLNLRINFLFIADFFGAADRDVESLRLQVSIVRR